MSHSPGLGRCDQFLPLSPVVTHSIGEPARFVAVDPHLPLSILIGVIPVKQWKQGDIGFLRRRVVIGNPQDVASRVGEAVR
jgi:hypothetical protein